jgi:hypothetical protein
MSQLTFKGSHFPKCVILQTVFWSWGLNIIIILTPWFEVLSSENLTISSSVFHNLSLKTLEIIITING